MPNGEDVLEAAIGSVIATFVVAIAIGFLGYTSTSEISKTIKRA